MPEFCSRKTAEKVPSFDRRVTAESMEKGKEQRMEKAEADRMIKEYLPKIYGFAMKRAFSYDEAEDLAGTVEE